MDLKLISRFKQNSLKMLTIYILFSSLISFAFTIDLSNNDILNDKLYSAALEVISLHSYSFIDEITEELPNALNKDIDSITEEPPNTTAEDIDDTTEEPPNTTAEDIDEERHRSRRTVPSFFNIPVLDNSSNLMPNYVLDSVYKVSEVMNNLKDRLVFHLTYLQKLSDALKNAIKPKTNHLVITSNLIRNLTSLRGINAKQMNALNIVWQNSKLNANDLKFKLKDLILRNGIIEQRIGSLLQKITDVVLKNRPSLITGHKHFVGHIQVTALNTTSATIGFVDRQALGGVMSNLYRKSRPQVVKGVKHVIKPTLVRRSLDSLLINNINVKQQIVTTNNPQIIKGLIQYNSQLTVINDLRIRGRLNGLDLDRDLVFLNKPETILAPKVFISPLIRALVVNCRTIDGINLNELSQNVLLSNGLQTIRSTLVFTKPLTTGSIAVNGLVNGIDISSMADELVYKNRPVFIRGKKTFILDDLIIKNNLYVRNRLDGLLVPNDLLLRDGFQTIKALKRFVGNTRFEGKVFVNGFVDGLRLPQDIVTLTRNETIFGPLVFGRSISVNQDIIARRLVDGVDLSNLRLSSLKMNESLIQSNVRFLRPVSVGAVVLTGTVNGVDLSLLSKEVIFKNSPNVEIRGTKTFATEVVVNRLLTESVNDIKLSDLMSTHNNETIFSSKHFTNYTKFGSITVNGLVGRVDVVKLYNNRISLSKPQVIKGVKHFTNELIVKDRLSVTHINHLVPEIDFVLKSKPQKINGQKIFIKPLNANKLMVKNPMTVKGRINNIPLNDINSKRIRLNVHQTIPLSLTLSNCNSTSVDILQHLNGLDITEFAINVMSLTRPQTVFAPKLLRGNQTFYAIQTSKGINGISLSYLKANAVNLNGLSNIRETFTFTHPLVLNKPLQVNGVINGVNISYIRSDAVFKTLKNIIVGNNVFNSGFRVNGNIHALSFNGFDLSNELLTNTRDHVIRGGVVFTKTLKTNRNIVLDGLVNGLKLSEFSKSVIKINDKNIIYGNLELNGFTKVAKDMKISGTLNNINLTQLFNNAVLLNTDQDITGIKTISAPIHAMSHLNTSLLNGINVPQILNDIVYINSHNEQHIRAPKTFTGDIISNGLIQTNGRAMMLNINGIDLKRLDYEAIKVNAPTVLLKIQNFQNLTIIGNNFTRIEGRINGIDLMREAIPLRISTNPQIITGRKTFEHLILNDNLVLNGLVNGLSLKDIEKNTFFTSNDQLISGRKIFRGLLVLNSGHNVVSTLNGMRIPEDLVPLNVNQNLTSHLVFNNPLFVERNLFVRGSVSGHNLTKLALESLVKDSPQMLTQPIKFDTIVFRNDVMVDQHVDNVDLSKLSKTVKQFTSKVNNTMDVMTTKANRHHFVSDYIYHSLEKSVFEIDFFDYYQSLEEIHGNRIDVLPTGAIILSETIESPQKVYSIQHNLKSDFFDVSVVNKNANYIQKSFTLKGEEYVIHTSLHSYNFSTHITKANELIAPLGYFISFVEVLNINENKVVLVSFQSNSGKLMVHSLERLPNKKLIFEPITEATVGTDTSKVIAFVKQSQVHIVVAKYYGMNCVTDSTGTLVFVLKNGRALELIQKISLMSVVDVIHFENNGRHYLALSDSTSAESSLNPQTIYIYRSELMRQLCGFSLFQKLFFDNTIQLSAFTYGTTHSLHQYLVAVNSSNVMVWRQRGESGFTDNWLLNTKSARVVAPVIAAGNLYLIVGQRYRCHESLVFRAENRGMALTPIVFNTKHN